MEDYSTDLSDLFDWSPLEMENAAPAGTGSGVETSAAQKTALHKHTESGLENQAWAALDATQLRCAWREEARNGKPTKAPYPTPERMAKANDPAIWLSDLPLVVHPAATGAGS